MTHRTAPVALHALHALHTLRSGVAAALFLFTFVAQPAAAASDREIAELISQFSDDKSAASALEKVTKIGAPAVDQLVGLALEKQDTAKRGWAIAALGFIGGGITSDSGPGL